MSATDAAARSREIPDFRAEVLAPRASAICVLVFVINEGERFRQQLVRMSRLDSSIDVAIADGGSTDGSVDLAHLRATGVRALLTKTGPGRLSAQMRVALSWAMDEGYEGVIVIDGNGKDHVGAIPEFARLLRDGFDHVQGSRFIPGGAAINTPAARLLGVRLIHAPLISLAARRRHTDTTNGFRAYSSRLILDPEIAVFRSAFQTYELHYHLAIESSRSRRFRVVETPVTREYPARGRVPTKIKGLRGNASVLWVLLKAVSGRYRSRSRV